MDKNIAALLREDAKTVHVVFDPLLVEIVDLTAGTSAAQRTKKYTYVTHLDVKPSDAVIVEAAGELKLAYVAVVDSEVRLEPNSSTQYKWVIDKIDMAGYEANIARNAEIEQTVAQAYRNNLRRSFAQQILAGVDDAHRDQLNKLLGTSAA